MSEQEREEYVGRRIREHEERGDTSYSVGDFYEEWDTRARYTGGPLSREELYIVGEIETELLPPDCPHCGSTNLWYWDGYWRCGGCGQEWPDQDGEE